MYEGKDGGTWEGEDCCMRWRRLEVDCTAWEIWSATTDFAVPSLALALPPDDADLSIALSIRFASPRTEDINHFSSSIVLYLIVFILTNIVDQTRPSMRPGPVKYYCSSNIKFQEILVLVLSSHKFLLYFNSVYNIFFS